MKKSRISGGDVAVMEVSPQSSLGVRTRAKTLALQRLQKSSSPETDASSFSYLQLRSRRLEKVVVDTKKPPSPSLPRGQNKKCCRESSEAEYCGAVVNSRVNEKEGVFSGKIAKETEAEENVDLGIEGFCGENFLEIEGRDRYFILLSCVIFIS